MINSYEFLRENNNYGKLKSKKDKAMLLLHLPPLFFFFFFRPLYFLLFWVFSGFQKISLSGGFCGCVLLFSRIA